MQPLLNLPFAKRKNEQAAESKVPAAATPPSDDELRLKLYRQIIERYRDTIEEMETKSVSDLKSCVKPRDSRVLEIKERITEDFHPFVYGEHFPAAARQAFSYLSTFHTLSSPVSFWLSFEEMLELLAGDEIDKSILLCSLLRCLGCDNAKVFVTDSKKSYVLFQFSGKSFVADHSQTQLVEKQSGGEALSSLEGKILYSFNDLEYEDFSEG